METRKSEARFTTSDPREMNGMYIASRVVKSWIEDFVDEDTGEVAAIERKEVLFNQGTLIDEDVLPQILFHLQAGDIKEVEVSDQCRKGVIIYSSYLQPYKVTALIDRKSTSFILQALSVKSALEVATDYIELNYNEYFSLTSAKRLKSMVIIDNEEIVNDGSESENTPDTRKYYTIEVNVMEDGGDFPDELVCNYEFVLKAQDVDSAKDEILEKINELQATRKNDEPKELHIKTVKAAPLSCHKVIEYEFCLAYAQDVDHVQCH